MSLTNEDLDTLESAAKAATPGPWNVFNGFIVETCPDEKGYTTAVVDGYVWDRAVSVKDATFIAAANPTTMLALIAEIRKLRAELEYVRELHAEVSAALRNKELDAMLADNELMEFMQKQ